MKTVLFFLALSVSLTALPKGEEVKAGEASFCSDSKTLSVTASDRAIIQYQQFDIGNGETVYFLQPSARSCVLNRVVGGGESQILGRLQGNGQIFLVNPQGIYFGPDAVVNAGAFLATSLSIRDEDFLNDVWNFTSDSAGRVVNEGLIQADGFVALFAPVVENRGSIYARVGKVFVGAAERVAIDFEGDGLIQFRVDGELAKIPVGDVRMSQRAARKAIQSVMNTDGIEVAAGIAESGGVVRLVGRSEIVARHVQIEGETVEASGAIEASETAEILGDRIALKGLTVEASGDFGGGEVFVGGDYQGKGPRRNAQWVTIDELSEVRADARIAGDGGKVIVWSDDTTLFDGKIFARGGRESGNGGFVETSGKENLGVGVGYVNTSAANGKYGDWLLDPNTITIATAGGGTIAQGSAPNCSTGGNLSISVATMQAAASNVALCAQSAAGSSITVSNAFTMPTGISLSMTAGSGSAGTIALNANITTNGQPLSFTGVVTVGANVTLDTTNANAFPAGANISFSNTINGSGARTLALQGGTGGTIAMSGAVGGTTALTSLTATGATITQSSTAKTTGAISYTGSTAINIDGNVTTSGGAITMTGPVVIANSPTIDSTNAGGTAAGATISFSSTVNGANALTIRAGTGGNAVFSGAVGGVNALTNLSFTSANTIQIGGNITVTGANTLTFPDPVSITGTSTITSNNANIGFSSTVNGANALTIAGGTGTTTFTGAVGGTTALSSLSVTAATVTQSSTAKTTGSLSYTGSTAINIDGNITTSGGTIAMMGPVTIANSPTLDSTNAGGTAGGATVSFSSTVNGANALTIRAGTGGNASFSGAVGGTAALTNLVFTSANTIQIGANITVTGANS